MVKQRSTNCRKQLCWGRQGRKLGSRSLEEEMGTQTSETGWRREYWLEPTSAGTSSASIPPPVALLAGLSREPAGEEEQCLHSPSPIVGSVQKGVCGDEL